MKESLQVFNQNFKPMLYIEFLCYRIEFSYIFVIVKTALMRKWLVYSVPVFIIVLCMLPEIVPAQIISTIAGCGIGDDSMATRAELDRPVAVAMDNLGNTYIADYDNGLVRKVNAAGIISSIALLQFMMCWVEK